MLLSRVYYVRVLAVMLCTMVEQFTPWLNWVWMDTFEYAILYSACILGVWISPLQWTSLMRQMTNIVLTACVQHRYLEEVFKLSSLLHRSVSSVDRIGLNNVLSASAELGYFEMVKQVHAYAIKVGLLGDTMLSNVLIDTYAKCGSLDDAKTLSEMIGAGRDVFPWSSLIAGYAQFGYAKDVLDLFVRMRSLEIKPNHVTFVGVLTACSSVGHVDEDCYYYSIMEPEYGIAPTREHCSCVIDLLARAGRLSERRQSLLIQCRLSMILLCGTHC
jgi:pentatricopeptide repeat protein